MDYHKADVVVRDGRTMISKQCNRWRVEAQLWKGDKMIAKMYEGMGTQATHPLSHPWVIFGSGMSVAVACVQVFNVVNWDLMGNMHFSGDVTAQHIEDSIERIELAASKERSERRKSGSGFKYDSVDP